MSNFGSYDYGRPFDRARDDQSSYYDRPPADAKWGWVAGLILVAFMLALAFGAGRGDKTSSQAPTNPPAAQRSIPPTTTPAPTPPPAR